MAGLATIVIALEGPIDKYADDLFWVHMLQHVLLLTVAPPLILLGRPWPRMWRALPLRTRRSSVGPASRGGDGPRPYQGAGAAAAGVGAFNATIVLWHIPAAYNATLSNQTIHNLEHAMFFFTGLLFWARSSSPGPLRPRLAWPMRVAYVVGAMIVGWILAIMLVLVPHPLYAHYADLAQRPGGITALTDQQIAGGVMWVLGSISYTIAMLIGFYAWLEPDSASPTAAVPANDGRPPTPPIPEPESEPHPPAALTT